MESDAGGNQSHTQNGLGEHSYRFALQDRESWLQHLRAFGYVVISQAMSSEEVAIAKDLLWKDFERVVPELSRNDIDSWGNWRLPRTGLVSSVTQDAGPWHVRGCPGIKEAFAGIWDTSELIVSMDCVIVWRPWWHNTSWKPQTEGLHLDQNPFDKPGLDCVQGMVPLLPVTAATGGLQVVPSSHTQEAKEHQKKRFSYLAGAGDWCPLHCDDMETQFLAADAGDLILWDSRTIHGGVVGPGQQPESTAAEHNQPTELARLSVTVAMTPRAWASEEVQQARVDGFQAGKNFNHCPHEAGTSSGTVRGKKRPDYKPIDLTDTQRALL